MKQHSFLFAFVVLLSVVISSGVSGHVPIDSEGNSGLSSAQEITNPTKSWAIYSQLENTNTVSYFKFDISKGDRIYIQLFVTTRENEKSFIPTFALMGPGIEDSGQTPDHVETIGNVMILDGQRGDPNYESFGPSHFVEISKIDIEAPASSTYYIAVFSETGTGHFGLAIGNQESFTLIETILNPVNVIEVHLWQGESWLYIMIPYLLTFAVGLVVYYRDFNFQTNLQKVIYILGLIFVSSSISFTFQTFYNVYQSELSTEVTISLIIIILQASIGAGVISLATEEKLENQTTKQVRLLVLSIFSLFTWVGFIIGPILGIVSAIFLLSQHFRSTDSSSASI